MAWNYYDGNSACYLLSSVDSQGAYGDNMVGGSAAPTPAPKPTPQPTLPPPTCNECVCQWNKEWLGTADTTETQDAQECCNLCEAVKCVAWNWYESDHSCWVLSKLNDPPVRTGKGMIGGHLKDSLRFANGTALFA